MGVVDTDTLCETLTRLKSAFGTVLTNLVSLCRVFRVRVVIIDARRSGLIGMVKTRSNFG